MSRTIREALQSIFEITQEAWHVRGDDVRLTEIRGIARGALAEPAEPVAEIAAMRAEQSDAARDVLAERRRQVEAEGRTLEHDDEHDMEELAFAAACYCTAEYGDAPPAVWPWDASWWKPKDRRTNLIRAAALLLAEIERLDRAARAKGATPHPVHSTKGTLA